jgi:nitric oxide reductase NorQ protein
MSIEFGYPPAPLERRIIERESGIDSGQAALLAQLGAEVRHLDKQNLLEGPSTRLLVHAGRLVVQGVAPKRACEVAVVQAMTDDALLAGGVRQVVEAIFK